MVSCDERVAVAVMFTTGAIFSAIGLRQGWTGSVRNRISAIVRQRAVFDTSAKAQIAQLVEHAIENRSVAGSIPALGTTFSLN